MPSTLQAVLALTLAVLPGALYLWGFEREAGKWGIGLSDQLLRFVTASAVFLAVWAAPMYLLYSHYAHVSAAEAKQGAQSSVEAGTLPVWLLVVPLLYVAMPLALGTLAGIGVRRKKGLLHAFARVAAGRDPAPRAWDALFAGKPRGLIRLRMKEGGGWVGGRFASDSYASGFPEPQDLLLEQSYKMGDDGAFAEDEHGKTVEIGSRALIRWEDVDIIEFFPDEQGDA